jgi:hypothetical protein
LVYAEIVSSEKFCICIVFSYFLSGGSDGGAHTNFSASTATSFASLFTPKTYGVEGRWEFSDRTFNRSNHTTQPWY